MKLLYNKLFFAKFVQNIAYNKLIYIFLTNKRIV